MNQLERDRLKIAIDICHALGHGERLDAPRSSYGLKAHADSLRSIANGVKLSGGEVTKDYV